MVYDNKSNFQRNNGKKGSYHMFTYLFYSMPIYGKTRLLQCSTTAGYRNSAAALNLLTSDGVCLAGGSLITPSSDRVYPGAFCPSGLGTPEVRWSVLHLIACIIQERLKTSFQ